VVTKNFPKYLQNTGLTKNVLRAGQKAAPSQTCHITQIPRTRPLTLGDRMNFLPLTEPNPTDNLGEMMKSDYVIKNNEFR
jgi:hypothetical protein